MNINIRVHGLPRPGGSKRAFYNRKAARAMIVDANPKVHEWRNAVAAAAIEAYAGVVLTGPITLGIEFLMPRPKGHYGTGRNANQLKPSSPWHHTKKPDLTKLLRSTEDALTGIVWRDDSVVIETHVRKRHARLGERIGAIIKIETKKDGEQ